MEEWIDNLHTNATICIKQVGNATMLLIIEQLVYFNGFL